MAEPTFTLRLLNAYNVIALSPPSVAGKREAVAANICDPHDLTRAARTAQPVRNNETLV
jgi:hypothetical protein